MSTDAACHSASPPFAVDYKLKLAAAAFAAVLALSYLPVPFMAALNESLLEYVKLIWWAVLLGFLLGGLIDHFVPSSFVYRLLGQRRLRSILAAACAGFVLSACSHGILAIAIELHKKGANTPSVIAFLLASPWANLPVTVLLFGFFGWQALLLIGVAMVIAVITGCIFQMLERRGWIEPSPSPAAGATEGWSNVVNFRPKEAAVQTAAGAMRLANMVLWWIIVGVLMAACIGAFVPHHIFQDYFGASFGGLSATLLAATVIEVCSEGSAPVAFEIYRQIGTLGNPFVFLMAGVVTDYTEIGLLWANIGKKTAIMLPVVAVPQVLLAGYLFNLLL